MKPVCVDVGEPGIGYRDRVRSVKDAHQPNRARLAIDHVPRTEPLIALGAREHAVTRQGTHRLRIEGILGHIRETASTARALSDSRRS